MIRLALRVVRVGTLLAICHPDLNPPGVDVFELAARSAFSFSNLILLFVVAILAGLRAPPSAAHSLKLSATKLTDRYHHVVIAPPTQAAQLDVQFLGIGREPTDDSVAMPAVIRDVHRVPDRVSPLAALVGTKILSCGCDICSHCLIQLAALSAVY